MGGRKEEESVLSASWELELRHIREENGSLDGATNEHNVRVKSLVENIKEKGSTAKAKAVKAKGGPPRLREQGTTIQDRSGVDQCCLRCWCFFKICLATLAALVSQYIMLPMSVLQRLEAWFGKEGAETRYFTVEDNRGWKFITITLICHGLSRIARLKSEHSV